jgi:hypothetical protein
MDEPINILKNNTNSEKSLVQAPAPESASAPTSISTNKTIQLGDIIEIEAPANAQLNDKVFFVSYIDKNKLIIKNKSEGQIILSLNEDGELDDESILAINILDRDEREGYAKQNRLIPGSWLDIYFGGDMPLVITGEITNLENDMIEIRSFPDNNIIYLDFEYKGLPELLLIEKIVLRSAPSKEAEEGVGEEGVGEGRDPSLDVAIKKRESLAQFESIEDADLSAIEDIETQTINKELIVEADQIVFGEEMEEITLVVDVEEHEKRFSIDKQTTDMLNELLSNIPNAKRSQSLLNSIHTLIERFTQLREKFSKFDDGNIVGFKELAQASYKPLVENLKKLEHQLYWILPLVKNSKKVYDVENDEEALFVSELTLAQALIRESEIRDEWKANTNPEEQNKYTQYIRNLSNLYTPYTNYDLNNYIAEKQTLTNLHTIVDTLNDQYSYVAMAKENTIRAERFIVQLYNTGLNRLESKLTETRKIYNVPVKLTNNDTMLIKSFLTLPLPTVNFSRINLPKSSIMERSNLGRHFLAYWQFLKKRTSINTHLIDDFKAIDYEPHKFLNNIKNFLLDESLKNANEDPEIFEDYLNAFIPSNRRIFELVKKHISVGNALSLNKIINYLEPFLIYDDNVYLKQYESMVRYISQKIVEYKRTFVLNNKTFQAIHSKLAATAVAISSSGSQTGRASSKMNASAHLIFNILSINKEIETSVLNQYNISADDRQKFTSEELFNKMVRIDYARLFMSAISKISLDLMVSDVLDKFIKIDEQLKMGTGEERGEGADSKNDCSKYVLSKKYFALDELEYDNNKTIYFDKKYDNTFYDIINEYKQEHDAMPPDEFRAFLVAKLMENIGLSKEEAIRDTSAMIENKRQVIDGDYAILELEGDKNVIYKRENDEWIKDTSLSDDVFFNNNKFFCESIMNCYSVDGACVNVDITGKKIQKKNLRNIIGEFDQEYRLDLQKIRRRIDDEYLYNLQIISQIIWVEKERKLKNNELFLTLAHEIEEQDIIISPFERLRDFILGQSDFLKKQNNIMQFSLKYTRKAYDNEDPYWRYCIQTNIKLLPNFLFRLAQVYTNQGDYMREVDIICAEQGTISDDGEKWVDKYSGYVIKFIEYDTEEGFTVQGYKLQTRDILEKDMGEIILQGQGKAQAQTKGKSPTASAQKSVYLTPIAKMVLNIIITFATQMGINLDKQIDFILKNVLEIQKKNISSAQEYDKLIQKAERMGKKNLPTYEEAFDSSLLFLTFVYILIAIQTAIPPVKTQKTFPGCIKSFDGYPMEGSIDKSGLLYIACVAHKLKSSIKPWNSIRKMKETLIAKKMESIIETYIIENKDSKENQEIKDLYKLKRQFLELQENEIIPDTLDIKNWFTFLPPLIGLEARDFKDLTNISTNFKDELREHIRRGSKKQETDILVIASKRILFSLNIQASIQKIIKKEHPILTNTAGNPFLENACCNSSKNTLAYFTERDASIMRDNDTVAGLSNLLYDVNRMGMAASLIDPENTKFIYPSLATDFAEETIYKAFIKYCKFNNNLPISEELRAICLERPDPANYDIDDSIEAKISKLKADGKNYSQEAFEQLIDYVAKNNIINRGDGSNEISFTNSLVSNVDRLRELLLAFDESDSQTIPVIFREKFLQLLDTFSIAIKEDTEALRDFKNHIARQNDLMNAQVIDFIRKNSKLNKTKLAKFKLCLDEISQFNERNSTINTNKAIEFMKEAIRNIGKVIPNIVLNKIDYKNVAIPKHWKLSEKHNGDIKAIIRDYYSVLGGLYDDTQLSPIFERIQKRSSDIMLLSENTYYISPIIKDGIEYYSIFDKRLCLGLMTYYFYGILIEYINFTTDPNILQMSPSLELGAEFDKELKEAMAESTPFAAKAAAEPGKYEEIDELDIISGEKKELGLKVAQLIIKFVSIICNSKEKVDADYETVMKKVMRAREKEKTQITDFLKDLTDEEREIENLFKNNKLGNWNKGLQKGLTQYVKETYDDERAQMEKQAVLDAKLGLNDDVVGMNKAMFEIDMEAQDATAQEIEREEYDMSHLHEDDDYGEGDGDEGW